MMCMLYVLISYGRKQRGKMEIDHSLEPPGAMVNLSHGLFLQLVLVTKTSKPFQPLHQNIFGHT